MTLWNWTRTSAVLLALLAAAPMARTAPAPTDKSALGIVPAAAPIVVHLRGVEGTKDRVVALMKKALPELAPVVETFLNSAIKDGAYTDGRKLAGLAKDGPIFGVFTEMPKPGAEPKLAILATITKYEEFRDGVLKEDEVKGLKADAAGFESTTLDNGETIYFVNKKEYAVVTHDKDTAIAFTKKHKGLDERMSKEQAARFLGGDVAVYASMDMLNKEYADQIKQAKESATETLKTIAEAADKGQRSAFQMAQKLIGPIFQAVEDSQGIVFSLEFRPGGLAVHLESELRAGTPTAKALKSSQVSAFKGLESMPAGLIFYSGMQANQAVFDALGGMIFGVTGADDDKDGKALKDALAQLMKADPGTRLDAVNIPIEGIQTWQYKDPAKAVAAQLKLIESLGEGAAFQSGVLKGKPIIKPNAQKFGDFEFNSVQLTWDLEKMAEGAGGGAPLPDDAKKQLAEGMKKLLGEKLNYWFGTDGKEVVIVTAKDWAGAEKVLARRAKADDAVGKVAAFRDVRKELPEDANVLMLVDLVRYVGVMLDFAKPLIEATAPIPIKLPPAPVKLPPTFVGTAVTLQPERGSFDFFLSAPTVHEIYKNYVLPLIGGARGAAN